MKLLTYTVPEMALVATKVNVDAVRSSGTGSDEPIELPQVPAGRSSGGLNPIVP